MSQSVQLPHGERDPSTGTPPRASRSVRRTSSVDSTRPDGLDGLVQVLARVRDLATSVTGEATVIDTMELRAVVDYWNRRSVLAIETTPPDGRVAPLVGLSAASGFRGEVARQFPHHDDRKGLLYYVLDDLPAALQVAGHPLLRGGSPRLNQAPVVATTDVCAGWRTGGTMMNEIEINGRYGVARGPAAPALTSPEDPLAWHELPILSKHGMRRRRRLDVTDPLDCPTLRAEAFMRDTHAPEHGVETVLHEYSVSVEIDRSTFEVTSATAIPLVLPWIECSEAVGSTQRLIGRSVADLRRYVGPNLVGPSTCTHLNNMFRSLEDVPTLAELLPR